MNPSKIVSPFCTSLFFGPPPGPLPMILDIRFIVWLSDIMKPLRLSEMSYSQYRSNVNEVMDFQNMNVYFETPKTAY